MHFFGSEKTNLMDLLERTVKAFERRADEEKGAPAVSPSTSSDYVPMSVETFDNHIYFYANVNTDRCLDLIRRIRSIDNELRSQHLSRNLPPEYPPLPIWLHIQSNGGELFTGLNIAHQLATIRSPIYSIVEGVCASAATLISIACTKRYIMPGSFMLIHQLTSAAWGKYEDFQDEMNLLDMLMDEMYAFYETKTKMDRKRIKKLLSRDSWFPASECVELGLVDEILEDFSYEVHWR